MYKICLIAGNGLLPFEILKSFNQNEVFIICLKESGVSASNFKGYEVLEKSVFKVGSIIKEIKARKIKQIIFVGGIKKPSFYSIKPDLTGFMLMLKILKLKHKGDDAILKAITQFLEEKNLELVGVKDIASNLILQEVSITHKTPNDLELKNINFGLEVLEGISKFDIGQALVMQDGVVIGVEGVEGTDALIERCSKICYKNKSKPILIKAPKVGQTFKIDIPVIGLNTIQNLIKYNFAGVAILAGGTILLEKEKSKNLANEAGIFIFCK